MGPAQRRGDPGGARLLEGEGRGRDHRARSSSGWPWARPRPPAAWRSRGSRPTGWIADLLDQLEGAGGFEMLEPPTGSRGRSGPTRSRGYSWLDFLRRWGFGACLADDMGLGKTVQTLALIQRETGVEAAPKQRRPTLLICPTSVVGNWHKEAARFTPDLPVLVHHGQTRTKGAAFKKQAGEARPGPLQLRAAAPRLRAPRGGPLGRRDPRRGPEHQEPADQAGAGRAGAQGRLPDRADRHAGREPRRRPLVDHGVPQPRAGSAPRPSSSGPSTSRSRSSSDPEAAERLQRLTGPFILRRLKTDKSIIADLPEKLEMKVFCTLTKEQASLYAAVVEDAAEQTRGGRGHPAQGARPGHADRSSSRSATTPRSSSATTRRSPTARASWPA